MLTKGSVFLLAALPTLADRVTPGALQAGTGVTFVPDHPELVQVEQQDSLTAKCTVLDFGNFTIVGTAVNSDGNSIQSSQPYQGVATDQAAQDIVLSFSVQPPADGGGSGAAATA